MTKPSGHPTGSASSGTVSSHRGGSHSPGLVPSADTKTSSLPVWGGRSASEVRGTGASQDRQEPSPSDAVGHTCAVTGRASPPGTLILRRLVQARAAPFSLGVHSSLAHSASETLSFRTSCYLWRLFPSSDFIYKVFNQDLRGTIRCRDH